MKILKVAVIALIAVASYSTAANAQVIVKARIGGNDHRPVRRYHRPYHRPYHRVYRHRVYHRRGPYHRGPVRHY